MNKNLKRFKFFALITAVSVMTNLVGIQTVLAVTDPTTINATVSAGTTLEFDGGMSSTANFAAITSSATTQTSDVTLSVPINDVRGSSLGWTVASTITNLGMAGTDVKTNDGNGAGTGTLTITGTYTGEDYQNDHTRGSTEPAGEIKVVVDTVDTGNPTQVDITYPDGTAVPDQAVTGNVIAILGLTLTFGSAGHAVSDTWVLQVDSLNHEMIDSVTNTLDSTNASTVDMDARTSSSAYLEAADGSDNVVTSRGPGGSGTDKDLTAPAGTGSGKFTYNHVFTLNAHGYIRAGTYTGTLTLTLATT